MLGKHLGKLVRHLQRKAPPVKSPHEEMDESKRSFLRGATALAALSVISNLEGCEYDPYYYLDQNIDLSQVPELTEKGPVLTFKTLSEDQYYGALEQNWQRHGIVLDPRKIIKVPKDEDDAWEFRGDVSYMKEAMKDGGYTLIRLDSHNGFQDLFFSDSFGRNYTIKRTGGGPQLWLSGQYNLDETVNDYEVETLLKPVTQTRYLVSYEAISAQDQITSYGFADEMIQAVGPNINPQDRFSKLYVHDGHDEITTRAQFWEYVSECNDPMVIMTLLQGAPLEYLKPKSEDDLVKMIQTLPSNDPTCFIRLVDRLVARGHDSKAKYEYKAPMQSIIDGSGDCDDYAVLNSYWGKLNGFKVELAVWVGYIGEDEDVADHVNVVLTNPKTGERFFCDNTSIYSGEEVDTTMQKYLDDYKDYYPKEV